MDPNATLAILVQTLKDMEAPAADDAETRADLTETLGEAVADLLGWWLKGGFAPNPATLTDWLWIKNGREP